MNYLQTRREFLRWGLKGASLMATTSFVPSFLTQSLLAEEDQAFWQKSPERIMVVIQLAGGNDGLNTIIPYTNDLYYKARPLIAQKKETILKINDDLGFHQSLEGFKKLYDSGKLSVVQGVGYPNPDRSHFRSMDIWHGGIDPHVHSETGWLGRYFDAQCGGADLPAATIGMNLGKIFPNAFRNAHSLGVSLEDPESYLWEPSGTSKAFVEAQQSIFEELNRPQMEADPSLSFLQHTGMNAQISSQEVRSAVKKYRSKVSYPAGKLGESLSLIARMMSGGLGTRVYYAHQGGFDTHNDQNGRHDRLLRELGESCLAFQTDLEQIGIADRVVTLVFSEFGRRVQENASGGTDHGAAAPLFVFGKGIKGGLQGETPSLSDLVDGDLKFGTDFRQVYATVLDRWMKVPSDSILQRDFKKLGFI
ncbi:MAG: DUF1501 domain-containing protein [Verrucomicrobiota bacterium]